MERGHRCFLRILAPIAFCVIAMEPNMLIAAVPIDNGVVGIPEVKCEDEQVTIVFQTQKPFTGRIFVKGMSEKAECNLRFGKEKGSGTSVIFHLKGGLCNMRRQRKLGPQKGVEQTMTVVLSFHDTFITKVDRAYRCTCFFMEAEKVVTSQFEVSMLPTTDLIDTARMPLCTYQVRRGSVTGAVVQYAKVGEEVYHVWHCDGDMFGVLVHSCFVDDGAGQNKFQLLDDKGCSIEPIILGDLQYNQALNQAFVESHVFKYADKVSVYFQCAISMCMKSEGHCSTLTPPNCGPGARTRNQTTTTVQPSNTATTQTSAELTTPGVQPTGAQVTTSSSPSGAQTTKQASGSATTTVGQSSSQSGGSVDSGYGPPPLASSIATLRDSVLVRSTRNLSSLYGISRYRREFGDTDVPENVLTSRLEENAFDVATDKIYVLDLDDERAASPQAGTPPADNEQAAKDFFEVTTVRRSNNDKEICLNANGFGVLLAVFITATAVALTVALVMFLRQQRARLFVKL